MKTTHTPDTLTQASLAELASFQERPCLSLHQPTHRRYPDNRGPLCVLGLQGVAAVFGSLDRIEDMLAVPASTQLCLATADSADTV